MSTEVVQHRWQRDWNAQPLAQLQSRDMWRRVRMAGLLGLLVGLAGLFVFELWYRPVQTPLVAIAAPPYAWPLPPQAWAAEDVHGLADLDREESIRLMDVSPSWRSTESGLANFDRQLQTLARQGSATGSVIFYVSMLGVSDSSGRPALVPPGASPLKSESWIPLADLLDHLKAQHLPDAWHKLLVLDCNRVAVNWNLGVLSNGFADGLKDVVQAAGIPNLVILNSTSPGERGWASADLGGSVFGHFLRLGLAGAADSELDGGKGGNADRRVSLHELLHYLDRHVDDWVRRNRADRQQPMLVPASAADFTVVWALNQRAQRRLAEAEGDPSATANVSNDALNRLWMTHDRLTQLQPQRFDPLGWAQYEQKLLWLEQAAVAGPAYRASARAVQSQLQTFAAAIESRAATLTDPATLFARADLFGGRGEKRPPSLVTHSLALAQYLGDPDPKRVVDLRFKLAQLERAPSQSAVSQILAEAPPHEHAGQFVELYLLRLLDKQLPARLWQQPALLSQALSVSGHGDRVVVADDERVQFWSLPLAIAGNRARRSALDQMLIGNEAALNAANGLWTEADRHFSQTERMAQTVSEAYALRDRTWNEVPYLAAWLARPLPIDESPQAAAELDSEINGPLLNLIHGAHGLDATLAVGQASSATPVDESPPFTEQASHLRASLDHFDETFAHECNRLEVLKKGDARVQRRLDAVLAVPFVPAPQRNALRSLARQVALRLNDQDGESAAGAQGKKGAKKETNEKGEKAAAAAKPASESKAATDGKPKADAKSPAEPHPESTAKAQSSADAPADSADYLQRMLVRWQEHPALAILASDGNADNGNAAGAGENSMNKPAGPDAQQFAAQQSAAKRDLVSARIRYERRLRERLGELPGQLHRLRDEGNGVTEGTPLSGEHGDQAHVQAARSRAERLARAAAAIGLPPLDEDPIGRLRQWDVQQLLLWHCRRVLEDFWGPAEPNEQPVFSLAAADYLRGAQSLGDVAPVVQAECNRLSKLLDARREGASGGLHTVAADVLLVDEHEPVQVKVALQAGSEDAVAGLPAGHVAIYLRDRQGRIEGTARSIALPLPADSQGRIPLNLTVPGSALVGRGPVLEAVALLRGNTFIAPLVLHATQGVRVDFRPYHYGPPQVTLGGRSRKRASIEIILDCSNSMSEPTNMEGPGGTKKVSRLEAAKIALHEMLSQLAADGNARVGVRFYGHRVGWNLEKPDQILSQNNYARPIPDDLRPSEDVELVLPLGRFDSIAANGVFDLMKTLKPWGETPLYLALTEAVGDFAKDEPGTEKSIVVITDGVNYQFNSPNPKTRADVLTAIGSSKIPIYIVGFDISQGEAAEAAREFGALAKETDGKYVPVSDGTTLVRSLENLLGPKNYEVRMASGAVVGRAAVGAPISIRPKPSEPEDYTVSLGSVKTTIELSGGEAAELLLSADGRSIHAVGYDQDDPVFGQLVLGTPGVRIPWEFGVHRPVHQSDGVLLPFSVQRTDGEFSARPAESWIEATPRSADPKAQMPTYIFYDSNYEPGLPAPVAKWVAENWPAGAKQVEVRAWFKTDATKPGWSVKLGDVADRVPAGGTGATLSGLPGFSYQVRTRPAERGGEPLRVAVIERHTTGSPGPGSVKIEMFPTPTRIVHRFDPLNHLVTHTFYLEDVDEQTVPNYELRFTRREDIQHDAIQLLQPIVRNVSDASDLIRPTENDK
jgi:hypothetical protein